MFIDSTLQTPLTYISPIINMRCDFRVNLYPKEIQGFNFDLSKEELDDCNSDSVDYGQNISDLIMNDDEEFPQKNRVLDSPFSSYDKKSVAMSNNQENGRISIDFSNIENAIFHYPKDFESNMKEMNSQLNSDLKFQFDSVKEIFENVAEILVDIDAEKYPFISDRRTVKKLVVRKSIKKNDHKRGRKDS